MCRMSSGGRELKLVLALESGLVEAGDGNAAGGSVEAIDSVSLCTEEVC